MAPSSSESSVSVPWPWRQVVGLLGVLAATLSILGAFVVRLPVQVAVTQFMIPPFSYVCLGLAAIALTELTESRRRRLVMALALTALAVLNVLSYGVGGVAPLVILGVHVGFLLLWVAWRRRAAWTLLWLAETLIWVGIALLQGRLPL